MIKLTINPQKEKKVYLFKENEVVIGSSELSDLSFNKTLAPIHLRILKENQKYLIYNVANDPFSTINDLPFGKSYLNEKDVIQLGDTTILFEIAKDSETNLSINPLETQLNNKKSENLNNENRFYNNKFSEVLGNEKKNVPINLNSSIDKKKFKDEEIDFLKEYSIHKPKVKIQKEVEKEKFLKEEIKLENESNEEKKHAETFFQFSQDLNFQPEPIEARDSTEIHLNSFENVSSFAIDDIDYKQCFSSPINEDKSFEASSKNENLRDSPKFLSKNGKWKIWFSVFIIFFTCLALISNGVYSRLEEKNYHEEIQAARAVSDIALALLFAQIHHIQQPQQNWTDPHFLKNSIYSILTPNHQPLASIDINGRLNSGNYLLRIYMNRDLSRFLVIAQPEPSLMQWLAPQNAIVVDSKSMILHSMNDLKSLNRLLVNTNSLNGENGKDVFDLVKNEKIFPLKKLADDENRLGFMPPRQLEIMQLGAENFIYNAPRYSQIGEKLMDQAIDLVNRPGGNYEIKKLQEEISNISKLTHPVLYTSKGMRAALKAQKAFSALLPDEKFLIAYLTFDRDGSMKKSHLIIDPDANVVKGISKNFEIESDKESFQPLALATKASDYVRPNNEINRSDSKNDVYFKLKEIAKERSIKLKNISEHLVENINLNVNESIPNFNINFNQILNEYFSLNDKINEETKEKIEMIQKEFQNIPSSQFESYLNETGLKSFIKKNTLSLKKSNFLEIDFNRLLNQIIRADNLNELNEVTIKAYNFLKLENVHESTLLVQYQYKLRSAVLEKLNEMILSSKNETNQNDVRKLITNILRHSWVSDPIEQDHFLKKYALSNLKSE